MRCRWRCAARLSNAALHLVCVLNSDQHHTDTTTIDTQPEHAYLMGIADRLATSWCGPIETTLLGGSATELIGARTRVSPY